MYVCTYGTVCVCMCTGDSACEQVSLWVCMCDHSSLPAPLPGPGVSSSMSFEEEEEDEDENSSSSSQLNSNTRPSSATSRKSIKVSGELSCPVGGWMAVFGGLVIQVRGAVNVKK